MYLFIYLIIRTAVVSGLNNLRTSHTFGHLEHFQNHYFIIFHIYGFTFFITKQHTHTQVNGQRVCVWEYVCLVAGLIGLTWPELESGGWGYSLTWTS